MKIKTRVLLVGVILALPILAGCSDVLEASPETSPRTPEDIYLSAVGPEFPDVAPGDLVALGESSCDLVDAYGGDLDTLIADIAYDMTVDPSGWGYATPEEIGIVMRHALINLCPEWAYLTDGDAA